MSETSNPKHGEARSNDARADGSKPVARKDVTPQGFLSKVERAKQLSGNLRGGIRATLEDADATHFAEDDLVSMKFHGIYQQDDRDARAARRKEGLEKDYSFMIRICVPGGACSAEQYLDIDGLGQRYGDGGGDEEAEEHRQDRGPDLVVVRWGTRIGALHRFLPVGDAAFVQLGDLGFEVGLGFRLVLRVFMQVNCLIPHLRRAGDRTQ